MINKVLHDNRVLIFAMQYTMLRSWFIAFDSASSLCEMLMCVMLHYLCDTA
jgi:hypothetical protein